MKDALALAVALSLLSTLSCARNQTPAEPTAADAKAFLQVRKEFGSFSAYVWAFVGGRPTRLRRGTRVPARTGLSDALSKDLQRRGFRFVGTTIVYAFMQATGLVNDHVQGCFCLKRR